MTTKLILTTVRFYNLFIQFDTCFRYSSYSCECIGKQDPLPEPEALDLPDDLQLDEGETKDDGPEEENPFDIDAMKGTISGSVNYYQ